MSKIDIRKKVNFIWEIFWNISEKSLVCKVWQLAKMSPTLLQILTLMWICKDRTLHQSEPDIERLDRSN